MAGGRATRGGGGARVDAEVVRRAGRAMAEQVLASTDAVDHQECRQYRITIGVVRHRRCSAPSPCSPLA